MIFAEISFSLYKPRPAVVAFLMPESSTRQDLSTKYLVPARIRARSNRLGYSCANKIAWRCEDFWTGRYLKSK